jgi:hypothetical protein
MIDNRDIIDALSHLGGMITDYLNGNSGNRAAIETAVDSSCRDNYWFTKNNILKALDAIANKMLKPAKLNDWIDRYSFDSRKPQKIGLIMAGNIPLVNFHDLLSVLLSGNIAVIKPSSKDKSLIKALVGILMNRLPVLAERIVFTDTKPQNINAVIATGSNNSARYFDAEYKNIPMLVRKNRYSLAALDGNETRTDLEALGDDIFSYFGLGCRNVSNILIPQKYDWSMFFDSIQKYSYVLHHQGYKNCFRYQKALSELSGDNYLNGGFVIIRMNNPAFSSIAAINYMVYKDIEQIKTFLSEQNDRIQCIVTKIAGVKKPTPFGHTQQPELTDYADGVDTVNFLTSLKTEYAAHAINL